MLVIHTLNNILLVIKIYIYIYFNLFKLAIMIIYIAI